MKRQVPMNNGAEYDAFTRWNHLLCYLARPGVKKRIKRGFNRRERKALKMNLLKELTE